MPRRRLDDYLPDASAAFAPDVAQPVAFDQTGNSDPMGMPAPPPEMVDPSLEPTQEEIAAPPMMPGIMPEDPGMVTSDQLSDADLAALVGEEGPPEDVSVEDLIAAYQDPNTPPAEREAIQERLAQAARRRLAGLT